MMSRGPIKGPFMVNARYVGCQSLVRGKNMIRTVASAAALALLVPSVAYAALAALLPIGIATFSAPPPTAGRNGLNAVKGTATYRLYGQTTTKSLIAYGNGDGTGVRQCVELVKRYATGLGFPNFVGKINSSNISTGPALGNGYQVAGNFAYESKGSFVFIANGATTLPKPGAVLSISTWNSAAGAYGHVGIVINYTQPSSTATSATIQLFEQNMPIDSWKTVTFTKSSGRWYGTMRNTTFYPSVVGWANPAG